MKNEGIKSEINDNLLEIKNLKMHFPIHGGIFYRHIANVFAVDGVSFSIKKGETIGLVGESGCGKSTLGKALLRLYKATDGEVFFRNEENKLVDINKLGSRQLRVMRKNMQMIFQDPMESLNPRMTIGSILEEPFIIHKGEHNFKTYEKRKVEIIRLLNAVGLSEAAFHKYPHEFSGGQRQRIGIARSIALRPQLIVCDEPVSALDVSVQSQVLNLLVKLQKDLDLTYIFIAHNLSVVKYIADRIFVMYLGKIVESTNSEEIYRNPLHPYTKALISAIPEPDPMLKKKKQILIGDVPSPINPPSGCHFHTRCPFVEELCKIKVPELREIEPQHCVSCHFAEKLKNI